MCIRDSPYTVMLEQLRAGNIATLVVSEGEVEGSLRASTKLPTTGGGDVAPTIKDVEHFSTVRVPGDDEALMSMVESLSPTTRPVVTGRQDSGLGQLILFWVIVSGVFLVGLFFLMRLISPNRQVMSFGKSRARVYAEKETKVTFEAAAALQRMGDKAEYVKISGNGPNALDFHIAFYIGQISMTDPTAFFHVVSKDTGFDPLIQHLKGRKIFAARSVDVSEIPLVKVANTRTPAEKLAVVINNLQQRGASMPRTLKTLTSTVSAIFQKQLSEQELEQEPEGALSPLPT